MLDLVDLGHFTGLVSMGWYVLTTKQRSNSGARLFVVTTAAAAAEVSGYFYLAPIFAYGSLADLALHLVVNTCTPYVYRDTHSCS